MEIREIQIESDYQILKEWYSKRDEECPIREILPSIGFVVEYEGKPICMAFVALMVGIGLYQVHYLTVPKDLPSLLIGRALPFMMDSIHDIVKDDGYTHGYVATSHPSLIGFLGMIGWVVIEEKLTLLMRN